MTTWYENVPIERNQTTAQNDSKRFGRSTVTPVLQFNGATATENDSIRFISFLMTKPLDTSYYNKRRHAWLADEETRTEYERARHEIEQIDAVIRSLDELRQDAGMSKAELARRVGRNPASIRRLLTAEQARPELPLIISIANALDASVEIKPHSPKTNRKRTIRDTTAA